MRINHKQILSQLTTLATMRVLYDRNHLKNTAVPQFIPQGREQVLYSMIKNQVRNSSHFSALQQALLLAAKGDLSKANQIFNKLLNAPLPAQIRSLINRHLQNHQRQQQQQNQPQKIDLNTPEAIATSIRNGTDNNAFRAFVVAQAEELDLENFNQQQALEEWNQQENKALDADNIAEEELAEDEIFEENAENDANTVNAPRPEMSGGESEIFDKKKTEEALVFYKEFSQGESKTSLAEACKKFMVQSLEESSVESLASRMTAAPAA